MYSFLFLCCIVNTPLFVFVFFFSYQSELNFLTRQNYPVTMETLAVRTWRPGIQFQHWIPSLLAAPHPPPLLLLPLFYCFQHPLSYPPLIYSCFRAQTGSLLQPALPQRRDTASTMSRMQSLWKIQLISSPCLYIFLLSPFLKKKKTFFFFITNSPSSLPVIFIPSPCGSLGGTLLTPH